MAKIIYKIISFKQGVNGDEDFIAPEDIETLSNLQQEVRMKK